MEKQEYFFIAMLLPALLVSSTVTCYPMSNADISLKREFSTTVKQVLNTIKSQCGVKTMNWNEYCQDGSPVKCPPSDQEPLGDFYGHHCPLAYFNQEIEQWKEETFDSPEYIEKQLIAKLETFPPVQCGNDGDSCARDKEFCYRGVDASGICMDAEQYCKENTPSRLCQEEAGIFIAKNELLKALEKMKQKNPKKETSIGATVKSNDNFPVIKNDVNMKRRFKKGFIKILNLVKSKCNDMEMNWNEYCHDGSRLQCPDRGREPSEYFYSQHCPLGYLAREIEDWQEDTFGSPELIKERLMATLETFPREECGNEGSSCSRDTEICYRRVDEAGICLKADEICLSDQSSILCLMEAETFIVKIELMKLIENLKANYSEPAIYVASDTSDTDTNSMNFKLGFITALWRTQSSIRPTCGDLELNWDDYCQHASPKKCPDRGQMPSSFYALHCSLVYFRQQIERWEDGVYNWFTTALDQLPPIHCGNDGESCNEFCLRDSYGVCKTAGEICRDSSSHVCQKKGSFLLKPHM